MPPFFGFVAAILLLMYARLSGGRFPSLMGGNRGFELFFLLVGFGISLVVSWWMLILFPLAFLWGCVGAIRKKSSGN